MKLRMNEVQAPFWKRLLAYVIDAVITNIVVIWPFQGTIKQVSGDLEFNNIVGAYKYINTSESIRSSLPALTILFVIIAVLTVAYWAILEYKTRQSIGKMLLKIYVKSDEKELTMKQCIARNISKISGLLLIIDSVGIISNNQRFLERASKTRVIEKRLMI